MSWHEGKVLHFELYVQRFVADELSDNQNNSTMALFALK